MKPRGRWFVVSALWHKVYGTARGSLLLCVLSGAVFSLPYFVEGLFPLTYLALTAFLFLLGHEPLQGKAFRAFYCFLLGFLFPLYLWFTALYPLSSFGFSKATAFAILLLCCLGIPAVQGAVQAAVLQLSRFLPRGKTGAAPFLRAFGLASLWVLSEKLLTVGSLALPWGTMALSQTGCLPLLQTVSLFGADWIAFLAVAVCALIAEALRCGRKPLLAVGSGLFAAAILAGCVLLLLPTEEAEPLSVAAIQANISTDEKWENEYLVKDFEAYRDLTEQAAKRGAKLILLPESAVPVNFTVGGVLRETFSSIAAEYDCTILMGVLRRDENGDLHNSLLAISPDGNLSAFYDKQHPVPFGEMLPLKGLISVLFPPLARMNLGEELTVSPTDEVLQVGDDRVGCYICFDSVFGSGKRAKADTSFSVIATNDAWFRDSAGVKQHLRYAKLRAAESGKPVLRAANTGISALLDGKGRILRQTAPLERDVLYGKLFPGGRTTLYGHTGSLFPVFSASYLLLAFAGRLISFLRKRNAGNA